jgi:hypothetical protein
MATEHGKHVKPTGACAEINRLKRLIYRFATAMMVMFAIFAVALVAGLWAITDLIDDKAQLTTTLRDSRIERVVAECEATNEFRIFLRDFFNRLDGDSGDSESVKLLPEYQSLDEPTRFFVDALVAQSASRREGIAELRADYVEQYPLLDCDTTRRVVVEELQG